MSAYTANLPDLSNGYVVIDTETTGLLHDPAARIIEVGVLAHRPGQKPKLKTTLIKSVEEVPAEITHLTGITTEQLSLSGMPPELAYEGLFNMSELLDVDLPIVGHNFIGFDWPFLEQEARLLGAKFETEARRLLVPDRFIDTGALFKGIALNEAPWGGEGHYNWACRVLEIHAFGLYWNLPNAARTYGVSLEPAYLHRARGDVLACYRLFKAILKAQQEVPDDN